VSEQPLDELFLIWLYSQVADPDDQDSSRTYWKLLRQLYTTEFFWLIPNDDNRIEDAKQLRREFLDAQGIDSVDRNWMELGCSVLELMVGLSRRLSFEADGEPHYWFWQLIINLDLERYPDSRRFTSDRIDDILDRVIWRTYDRNGHGGFFPLKRRCKDQRNVELWYQLSAYVLELN
jgi:hypothetical protein